MATPACDPPVTLAGLLERESLLSSAVVDEDGCYPFGSIRDSASGVASILADLGVRAGDRVGVHLDTTARAMVGVHAALRAGAVVVPIDIRAPADAVAAQLRDCDVEVIVGDVAAPRADAIAGLATVRAVVGNCEATSIEVHDWMAEPGPGRAPVSVDPDDPAYIIYTSGSTGRPKGIVHSHRSALAYARLAAATYELRPDDVVATLSPLQFDQSTFSLYAAPLAGSSVCMIPDVVLRFPADLTDLVARRGVSVWYSVPTILIQALRRGVLDERDLGGLRWVLFGGEVFPEVELGEIRAALSAARFSNVYGPAEVNQCTYHHLEGIYGPDRPLPIGRAWEETEVVVVDDEQRPVGAGEVGEVLVRSSTMMLGYWGRPDLDDEAFGSAPVGIESAGDWYATGDRAVRADDGQLLFRGRTDNQVKLRGHRVELEAVDLVAADLDHVEAAVTVCHAGTDGLDSLVLLVETDGEIDERSARRALASRLPSYAVPSAVRVVSEIPRTTTGKVDRLAAAVLLESRSRTDG